jgi:diguanylate cyclase (GGDEF)-like protein
MSMKHIKQLKNFILINNILSITIPLLLLGAVIVPLIFYYGTREISQKNAMMADIISQRLSVFVEESMGTLYQISGLINSGVFVDNAAVIAYLGGVAAESPSFEGFELIDHNGIVKVVMPENINILGANRSSQAFFSSPIATKKPYISSTFISQQTGQPTMTIAIPSGDGVLVGYLSLKEISQLSRNLSADYGDQVSVAITDGNGVYVSSRDMNKVYQRQIEENFETNHPEDNGDNAPVTAQYNDQTMIVSHYHVSSPGGWYVFVYQSYASVMDTIKPILGIVLAFSIFLIVLSRFVARFVFKDINLSISELNHQTREIAAGDYHPIERANRFNEFDILTENFNEMVESIRKRDEMLKTRAYYDEQTRLPNGFYLNEQLSRLVSEQEKIAVICFDVENFKRINETYGPSFGDEVLGKIGSRFLGLKLENGFVARTNGSNFILVLTAGVEPDSVLREIERIRFVFNQGICINESTIYVRFHIGIALFPDDGLLGEELLQYAHTAATVAKQKGSYQHAFFETAMKQNLLRNMTLENSLRSALNNHEFYLHYQPQIDVRTGKIRGFEALIRWEHPLLGKISPLEFIHIAETTGLIVPMGIWVLETACRQICMMNEKMGTRILISVNISPIQLTQEQFPETVAEVLERTGLEPELLELEITESVFIHSYDDALTAFNRLKAMGIKMSLDDFGTGYSSLAHLKNLPIDTLKIDQAFTRDLLIKKSHEQLMESIIIMAHTLNMDVIVEGVEESEQFACLKNQHCDHVQGYYFSRPIEAVKMAECIKKWDD